MPTVVVVMGCFIVGLAGPPETIDAFVGFLTPSGEFIMNQRRFKMLECISQGIHLSRFSINGRICFQILLGNLAISGHVRAWPALRSHVQQSGSLCAPRPPPHAHISPKGALRVQGKAPGETGGLARQQS